MTTASKLVSRPDPFPDEISVEIEAASDGSHRADDRFDSGKKFGTQTAQVVLIYNHSYYC